MSEDVFLTRRQSQLADRLAMEKFALPGIVLMENAGRGCADTLCRLGINGLVVVCCGTGNNAGDGFVVARHLDLRGYPTRVLLWGGPERLRGDAACNYKALRQSGVPIMECAEIRDMNMLRTQLQTAAWIVDALLGTGAQGPPRPPLDGVIQLMNGISARKLAIDLPSGLDCDTGEPCGSTFRADHTCTFVAAKRGFRHEWARPFLGKVHVLDIGAPRALVAHVLRMTEGEETSAV